MHSEHFLIKSDRRRQEYRDLYTDFIIKFAKFYQSQFPQKAPPVSRDMDRKIARMAAKIYDFELEYATSKNIDAAKVAAKMTDEDFKDYKAWRVHLDVLPLLGDQWRATGNIIMTHSYDS